MSHTQEKKYIYIEIEDVTNHLRMEQKKKGKFKSHLTNYIEEQTQINI